MIVMAIQVLRRTGSRAEITRLATNPDEDEAEALAALSGSIG